MVTVKVRCWEMEEWGPGRLPRTVYATYPDFGLGHTLLTCLRCGMVFAVDVQSEAYGEPLAERLKSVSCWGCGIVLAGNSAEYPQTYVWEGKIHHFEPPTEYPPDETSIVREFPSIYGR